ncbi:MAG TPA: OmpA family protein [Candidatus Megaira endosymbiont of Hartmannula sinica]|nr:OmpA family protein [Candidatus Megaera endosymbiont of Hartmannula sinica]
MAHHEYHNMAKKGCANTKVSLIEEFRKEVGDRVFFDFGRATLDKAGQSAAHRQANWLKDHKGFDIEISGHTDRVGKAKFNDTLSLK